MTDEEAKVIDKLKQYRYAKSKQDDLWNQIISINSQVMSAKGQIIDDMPKSTIPEFDKIGKAIEKVEELTNMYFDQMKVAVQAQIEIESMINSLSDEREQRIIRLKYIDGLTFEKIAVKMDYVYRQILRIHKEAIKKMSSNVT